MPLFSVVIPTRNRAEMVVGSAIESVLAQSFEDFEVVVCDNASSDDTRARVEAIDDPRVRYIRSDEWIQKEKFFEYSLAHAKGEYSVLFFDDDIMCRDALKKAHVAIADSNTDILVFARNGVYFYESWFDPEWKNTLQIPKYNGNVYEYDSATSLYEFYQERELKLETPMVTNAFFKTTFIVELIKRYGSLFLHGHMGDYNVAVFTLLHSKSFRFLNDPIVIFGHWKENTTQQLHFLQSSMPEYQEWIDDIKANMLVDMPFQEYLWSNCIWASLKDMQEKLAIPYDLDWDNYLSDIGSELANISSKGVDTKVLEEALQRVEAEFAPSTMITNKAADSADVPAISPKVVSHGRRSEGVVFPETAKGAVLGFNDIYGATRFFESFNRELTGEQIEQLSEEEKRARLYCIDIKQNREAGLRYFINRLHEIESGPYQKVVLASANSIAKMAIRFLGEKVSAVVDSYAAGEGKEFDGSVPLLPIESLGHAECDLVIVAKPNAPELVSAIDRLNESRSKAFDILVIE